VEIVLVRHAQPDWEPGGRAVDDPSLTPFGRQQAQRTAEALAGERFDALYVSPLRRVRETAAPTAEKLGLEPRPCAWLREIGLPSLAGSSRDQVRRYFADANARELESHWDGPPGGESFRHFYERVSAGVEGLLLGDHRLRVHEDGAHRLWQRPQALERLLIFAHEGTLSVLISFLLGIEEVPWAALRFPAAWAAIHRLELRPLASGHVWALATFNRAEHLPGREAPAPDTSSGSAPGAGG